MRSSVGVGWEIQDARIFDSLERFLLDVLTMSEQQNGPGQRWLVGVGSLIGICQYRDAGPSIFGVLTAIILRLTLMSSSLVNVAESGSRSTAP